MWECPILALVSNTSPRQHTCLKENNHHHHHNNNNNSSSSGTDTALKQRHMFCVSPDYCVNMARYWLGHYEEGRFDLQQADGPHLLDLGDILYAPNLLTDKQVMHRQQWRATSITGWPPWWQQLDCALVSWGGCRVTPLSPTAASRPLMVDVYSRQQQWGKRQRIGGSMQHCMFTPPWLCHTPHHT
jgi:sucrose-6-phosphate hydrolase SacC (GH32 family)